MERRERAFPGGAAPGVKEHAVPAFGTGSQCVFCLIRGTVNKTVHPGPL